MNRNVDKSIDLDEVAVLVNNTERLLIHFKDFLPTMDLSVYKNDKSRKLMVEKYAIPQIVEDNLSFLINLLQSNGYVRTIDTKEFLLNDVDAYYNELNESWYKSWLKMIKWALNQGYSHDDIWDALYPATENDKLLHINHSTKTRYLFTQDKKPTIGLESFEITSSNNMTSFDNIAKISNSCFDYEEGLQGLLLICLDREDKIAAVYRCLESSLINHIEAHRFFIKKAMLYDASSIIFVHTFATEVNLEPQQEDNDFVVSMGAMASTLGIKFSDYLLVNSKEQYYSFKEQNIGSFS